MVGLEVVVAVLGSHEVYCAHMDMFKMKKGAGQFSSKTCRLPLTEAERVNGKPEAPHSMADVTWRVFRVMSEFVEGFQFLSELNREVTIFGSARTPVGSRWYQEAETLGRLLAESGYTVVTGGGPGIMEAANKGAKEAGGVSVGLNIELPMEQSLNHFVTKSQSFYYFFSRKVMLAASAQAYVYFPGGFGTQDELFEILTLIQTEKSESIPVVLVGKDYWSGWYEWLQKTMFESYDAIERRDLELFTIVDSAEEAFEIVRQSNHREFF